MCNAIFSIAEVSLASSVVLLIQKKSSCDRLVVRELWLRAVLGWSEQGVY